MRICKNTALFSLFLCVSNAVLIRRQDPKQLDDRLQQLEDEKRNVEEEKRKVQMPPVPTDHHVNNTAPNADALTSKTTGAGNTTKPESPADDQSTQSADQQHQGPMKPEIIAVICLSILLVLGIAGFAGYKLYQKKKSTRPNPYLTSSQNSEVRRKSNWFK